MIALVIAWAVTHGTLQVGVLPGSWLLSSDATPGRHSEGTMISKDEVRLPYRFELSWRRLGPEAGRSMHVIVAGGIVLVKADKIAFYAYDDATFASGEWTPVAGHDPNAEHVVVVTQDSRHVEVQIDGALAATYALSVSRVRTHVGIGMKSAPGYRSAIYVHDVTVTHLH